MNLRVLICLVGLFSGIPAFSQSDNQDTSASYTTKDSKRIDSSTGKLLFGVASFYDNKFEGRKTSTGEKFTQKKMTAACNRLPLNHWVKVTNLSNGRSVILRINDRMHPKNKRLIDLSRTAASKLGYLGKGLTKVEVEDLGKKKPAVLK